ncbi:MAG TPA: response regulator [Roseiflexaceae bacterium]|nr:response regulator [Roseiflexaceae bacterium]
MPHGLIVIADDNKTLTTLLYTILEEEGYHVFACDSGEAAYRAIAHLHPELAILDMQMEKPWSGLEVLRRLRSDTILSSIPVIIYTADTHSLRKIHHKLAAHHCHILEKPFDLNVLLDIVARTIVHGERELGGFSE